MSASPAASHDGTASRPELLRTFRALDAAGVSWCLLRDGTGVTDRGDIDVLVRRGSTDALHQVLRTEGFVRLPSWGYGTHAFFLRPDARLERWTKLDLVTEIAFGAGFALRTGAESACLARRTRDGDLWVLDPDDAFWALLLHRLLDKGSIDERSVDRLRQLSARARDDGPLARVVAAAEPLGWSPARILEAVGRGEFTALELEAGPALVRSWAAQQRVDVTRRVVAERVWRAVARIATIWRRRGLAVAMLGPDGSGKTTLAQGLRGSFPLPVRSLYLSPFPTGSAGGRRGIAFLRRLVRIWGGWLAGRAHVARGRLVVFDRYPLDARVSPRRALGPVGRLRRWVVGHACPAPELVFILDVPGETAHDRKGELDPATLEAERVQYRRLATRLRSSVVLDATRPPEDVRREAAAIVWRTWIRRWRPR
jgi:thymidylate kinase